MSKRKYDPMEFVELAAKGLSNRAIGRLKHIDESVVRRNLESVGYKRYTLPTDLHERFFFDLDKPIEVTGPTMITADWHIPLYDPEYVNKMIGVARERELKNLIIGGDFFNFDALSAYEPKQNEAGLERELAEGRAVMGVLLETFDRIVYIWGNHDARLHRALGYKMQFASAMRMLFGNLTEDELNKIEFSNLDHCWVRGYANAGGDWYVCHPANYSRIPLSTARAMAGKVNANVITAHAHHCAVGYDVSGERVVADIGGLFDRHKTAYLQRATTFPTWTQGFAYLDSPELRVCSPGWNLA